MSSSYNNNFDQEVLIEHISLAAKIWKRMPWVQLLIIGSLGIIVHPFVPLGIFIGWGILSLSIECLRAWYGVRILQNGSTADPEHTHRMLILMSVASGGTTGLGAALFLHYLPVLNDALLFIIVLVMPAASVISSSSRGLATAYGISTIVPPSIAWSYLHPEEALSVSVLITLYGAFIVLVAMENNKSLLRAIGIRRERDKLIQDLERRNFIAKAAMTQAEQSAKVRARTLATASHDLRQPLHALSIYSAVLAANPKPEVIKDVSLNINQVVHSLGSLLHGLLDLSKLTMHEVISDLQDISLDRVIAEICSEYRPHAQEKGLALIEELSPVRIQGDPVIIGRITRNLLDNAIKYTEHGTITVSTYLYIDKRGPLAVLSITDTGKGIPPSEHEHIFEEFYQLNHPDRFNNMGVGLGLAIVKRLCKLMGANISVDSEMGKGTCFKVSIPNVISQNDSQNNCHDLIDATVLHGRCAYVIDPESDILNGMNQLLSQWGMRVMEANSVAAAEILFGDYGKPDLLIADLRLGSQEDGVDFASRLQKENGHFPVIITTGEITSSTLMLVNERGFTLLHKPVSAEVLKKTVASALTDQKLKAHSIEPTEAAI